MSKESEEDVSEKVNCSMCNEFVKRDELQKMHGIMEPFTFKIMKACRTCFGDYYNWVKEDK